MSIALSDGITRQPSLLDATRESLSRIPRFFRLLLAAWLVVVAGQQITLALQSPAQRIRLDLQATASDLRALPWTRADVRVQSAVARNFGDRAYRLDATKYPAELSVTLLSLDRGTCLEARGTTRRIEGPVVIALEGYRSAADCRDDNTMVWRLMP
ncbi:MAG TPA: hypothetical protein VMC10_12000 [Stellaceae bacterium]|nr:hypothetical protein [Stellaceae bacterium]